LNEDAPLAAGFFIPRRGGGKQKLHKTGFPPVLSAAPPRFLQEKYFQAWPHNMTPAQGGGFKG
jgi:hypothetical protein